MGKYLKRIGSNSVLIVTNVQNSSNIADHEMDLTRQFIKNKIMFQHMVCAERQGGLKYLLCFKFQVYFLDDTDLRQKRNHYYLTVTNFLRKCFSSL